MTPLFPLFPSLMHRSVIFDNKDIKCNNPAKSGLLAYFIQKCVNKQTLNRLHTSSDVLLKTLQYRWLWYFSLRDFCLLSFSHSWRRWLRWLSCNGMQYCCVNINVWKWARNGLVWLTSPGRNWGFTGISSNLSDPCIRHLHTHLTRAQSIPVLAFD